MQHPIPFACDGAPIPFARDHKRRPGAKARAISRKAARRDKSARLFLAFAFPAEVLN